MSMNLGIKIILVLICLCFVFSLAPRTCTTEMKEADAERIASGVPYTMLDLKCKGVEAGELTTGWGTGFNKFLDWFGGFTSEDTVKNNVVYLLVGAVVIAAAATTLFPNAFALFGPIVLFILLSFLTIPWDLIQDTQQLGFGGDSVTGTIMVGFILIVFGFLTIFAVISFYKGNDF